MKKLLMLVLVAVAAFGQVDINNNSRNALIDLGRGVAWGSGGRGNVNNNYIFTPVNPSESFCLMVANKNPTNGHTFTLQVGSTTDQQLTTYTADNSRWAVTTAVSVSLNAFTAGNNASVYYGFFRIVGASRVVVSIAGSITAAGTPDTADVTIGQATATNAGALSCQPSVPNTPDQVVSGLVNGLSGPSGGVFDLPYDCPGTAQFNLAAGTDVLLVTGVAAKTIKICHFSFASSAPADFNLQIGTGATCGVGTTAITGVYKSIMNFIEDYGPYAGPGIVTTGANLCAHFSAATTMGGTITYAVF